jgi:hypothetical protein
LFRNAGIRAADKHAKPENALTQINQQSKSSPVLHGELCGRLSRGELPHLRNTGLRRAHSGKQMLQTT